MSNKEATACWNSSKAPWVLFSLGLSKGGETEPPASHFLRNLLGHVLPICLGSPQTRPLFNSRAHRCCPLAQPLSFCCGRLPFCHAWQSGVPSHSFSVKLPTGSTGALLGAGGAAGSAGRAEASRGCVVHHPPRGSRLLTTCGGLGPQEEMQPSESWASYLDQLLIYLIGLSMAGAYTLQPQPAAAESLATSSHDYVEFPWDLAWKYHFRAVQCVHRYPEGVRLSVISALDLQERAEWAQKFANGSESLGAVARKIFQERATHWAQVPLVTD